MFADAALAARIDRAEARMGADIADFFRASRPALSPFVLPISGGLAIYVAPASPMNKVIGLGFDTGLDVSALEEIERAWGERGEPVRIEMSILTDPALGTALTERGYKLLGFENVLGLDVRREPSRIEGHEGHEGHEGSRISVDVSTDDEYPTWIDIAVDAFMNLDGSGSPPPDAFSREQLRELLGEMAGVRGFIRYMARLDGEPVGEAAMRLDGDLAQMAGAGTRPHARGRGVQKALVQRRLDDARAAGCTLAVVTTAPGSRSQDNVTRRGFELLYTRAILVNTHGR